MKIYLGSDHAGFKLKEKIIEWLFEWGYDFEDLGTKKMHPKDDYPDCIAPVAHKVGENPTEYKGIILGGSGQGEAIVANRFPGVRAVVYYGGNPDIPKLSREHNDANVISLGARFISEEDAKSAIKIWLETDFSCDKRHVRRLRMIEDLDSAQHKIT